MQLGNILLTSWCAGQIAILEAMKLEISVRPPDSVAEALASGKVKVEKALVKPGDTVQAGSRLVLLRKG